MLPQFTVVNSQLPVISHETLSLKNIIAKIEDGKIAIYFYMIKLSDF
jgi:hypothetical protein